MTNGRTEPIASENARRGLRPSSVVRGSVHRTDTYLTAADRPLNLVAPECGAGPTRSDETTAGPSSSMVTRSAPNRKRLSSTGTVKADRRRCRDGRPDGPCEVLAGEGLGQRWPSRSSSRARLSIAMIDDQQSGPRLGWVVRPGHQLEGAVAMRRPRIPVRRIFVSGPTFESTSRGGSSGNTSSPSTISTRGPNGAPPGVAHREKQLAAGLVDVLERITRVAQSRCRSPTRTTTARPASPRNSTHGGQI
jgi:hypothetical protein